MEQPASDPRLTQVLHAAAAGDSRAADELLPLVYDELRRLARSHLARTPPGNTLQPTALVHEAYVRLIGGAAGDPGWNSRGHFFGAAAMAMRRILVERARRRRVKDRILNEMAADAGAGGPAGSDSPEFAAFEEPREDLIALDAALTRLESHDPRKARLVMLRYFAGLSGTLAAEALGVSERTAERDWRYAKAWLREEMGEFGGDE